jgi:hypothetical protein
MKDFQLDDAYLGDRYSLYLFEFAGFLVKPA